MNKTNLRYAILVLHFIAVHAHGQSLEDIRKAAEEGNPVAQVKMGYFYTQGLGVTKDYSEASKWFRKAAEQGNEDAHVKIAYMYAEGQGVPKDNLEAIKWWRKVADKGYGPAQFSLGYIYQHGHGVPEDHLEAVKWFRKAAEQGEIGALNGLALAYLEGQGVPQNFEEAIKWYRKAVDKGNVNSLLFIGDVHNRNRDYGEAVKIYQIFADKGDAYGQFNLGMAYFLGHGVPEDFVLAYMWLNLATANSIGETRKFYLEQREMVATFIKPQQLTNAQRLASEWKPKK